MENIQISIVIKALNEENKIAKCIESCLKEAESYSSEIILVDSLSTDNTVEIAKQYPIKIVQFSHQEEIGCGSSPQLGYQYSTGKYIYLIDGDMELCEGFLGKAISYLHENTTVAGVGGKLKDTQLFSIAERRRASLNENVTEAKNTSHLGGGGLYRKTAIESVEYFSHSGLLALEEFELGVRLTSKGWLLTRLADDALLHTGHVESTLEGLKRLWRNGRLAANGTLLKSAIGKVWFKKCALHLWYIFMPIVINVFIAIVLLVINYFTNLTFTTSLIVFSGQWLFVLGCIAIKKRSINNSLISIFTWHLTLLAITPSLFNRYTGPNVNINGVILKQ